MNERAIKKLRRKFVLTALISFVSVMVLMCLTIYSVNIIRKISIQSMSHSASPMILSWAMDLITISREEV